MALRTMSLVQNGYLGLADNIAQQGLVDDHVKVNDEVATYLNNRKRKEIMELEDDGRITVQILGSESHYPEHLELDIRDGQGHTVQLPA